MPTEHEKIMVLRHGQNGSTPARNGNQLNDDIETLLQYSLKHDAENIKIKLQEMIPEYTPQKSKAVL